MKAIFAGIFVMNIFIFFILELVSYRKNIRYIICSCSESLQNSKRNLRGEWITLMVAFPYIANGHGFGAWQEFTG